MKKHMLVILLSFYCFHSFAQRIEKFYDYKWEPCDPYLGCYIAVIEFKDSLWERNEYFIRGLAIQMQGHFRDSACEIPVGKFLWFYSNGRVKKQGMYANGEKSGLWLSYYSNGMPADSTFYIIGNPAGASKSWYLNGRLADSSYYESNGAAVYYSWFDNGDISSLGHLVNGKMDGNWAFYHKNSNVSAYESFYNGYVLTRQYFTSTGESMPDTTNHDHNAEFKGGMKAWNKYLKAALHYPKPDKITEEPIIIIQASIDENGKVTNAEVISPSYPEFDRIAINAIKRSPKWNPAVSHNRNVSSQFTQEITFLMPPPIMADPRW